ncbi:MAG: hypothetical protein FWD68_05380 [Alphaproteobacteria bacterium]|nr:hypothetical protein [Alphaproteobacteria bacterium]
MGNSADVTAVNSRVADVLADAAQQLLDTTVPPFGEGHCAAHVRKAFLSAFAKVGKKGVPETPYAYNYGEMYILAGFTEVASGKLDKARDPVLKGYIEKIGDVVVFAKNETHDNGHVEMYTSKGWVSDFEQAHFVPWPANYVGITFKIYRLVTIPEPAAS